MPNSAREFDTIARDIFAPVYPLIASQILERTGISRGRCLDVGCGTGYLGLAIAERSELGLTFFDQSEDMLAVARENIAGRGLEDRSRTLQGDVGHIPLDDGSTDLVVSRGSLFFWKRPDAAFAEIHRVLAPGGKAMIGGGFGSAALRDEITRKMEARQDEHGQWRAKLAANLSRQTVRTCEEALRKAGISDFEADLNDETGLWIIFGA